MREPETQPPLLNLVVVRARDLEVTRRFYATLGVAFERHRHGTGPEHYASETAQGVFELYPARGGEVDASTRLGFVVRDVDGIVTRLQAVGAPVRRAPHESEWGRRAVVEDPDGRRVELTGAR